MNNRIGLLSGLLAAQVLVIVALLVASDWSAGKTAEGLLPIEADQVVRFSVAAGEEAVALTRSEEGWQLDGGLPADGGKVAEVLEKLAKATAAWPVATSTATAERFEVTEDNFQRRLDVESRDGETATLYLGSSPGYRRVHARADGQDEVFSIDFSNYEAPAEAGQWLDRKLLQPRGGITRVRRDEAWSLERDDQAGDWLLDGVAADREAADRLVGRFNDLSVLGLAAEAGESRGSFTVEDDDGAHRLEVFFQEEEDDYSVVSSRREGRFEIATYIAEQMLIPAEDLLPGEDETADAGESADDPPSGQDEPDPAD